MFNLTNVDNDESSCRNKQYNYLRQFLYEKKARERKKGTQNSDI